MRILTRILLAATLLLGAAGASRAQTVDELISRGTINIGLLTDLPPFGLIGPDGNPQGYDVDVANLLGQYMGVKVNLVSLTGPNRIPFLLTNKVDLIVGTFGITPERAKQVLFSIPYSALQNKVYAAKGRQIAGPADLRGLRVGVPRGSVQDMLLTRMAGPNGMRMQRFDDDASTFQAILSGQVDAIGETDVTTEGLVRDKPGTDLDGKFLLLRQPNGITMRANQWNLHQWVNTFIYFVKNNGELDAIHRKWLNAPLPELPVF